MFFVLPRGKNWGRMSSEFGTNRRSGGSRSGLYKPIVAELQKNEPTWLAL